MSNDSLKVVAYKLPVWQHQAIKDLCQEGYYTSASEIIRVALMDYLCHISEVTSGGETEYWLSVDDTAFLDDVASSGTPKKSSCAKLPIRLHSFIDVILTHNPRFENRTNLIRLALAWFLANDSQIFHPWINLNSSFKQPSSNHHF